MNKNAGKKVSIEMVAKQGQGGKMANNNVNRGRALRIAVGITVLLLIMLNSATAVPIYGKIHNCDIVTWPGSYEVVEDLNASNGTAPGSYNCIIIAVSDVVVDGLGHTVNGTNVPNAYGVQVYNWPATHNVTIKNLKINNWDSGIFFRDNTEGYIINNIINGSNFAGIQIYEANNNTIADNILINSNASNYGLGIRVYNSINNTLYHNTASNNFYGIELLYNSNRNNITKNNISGNTRDGASLYMAHNNVLNNNDANSNKNMGMELYYSDNNTLRSNNASNNYYGIGLDYDNNNTLIDNNAHRNQAYGIGLYNSNNNNLTGNNADWNNGIWSGGNGIDLYQSNNNLLRNNNVHFNGNIGIVADTADNNTFRGNNASNNGGGINLFVGSNNTIAGNNASSNDYGIGIAYSLSGNNTLTDNTASNNNIMDFHSTGSAPHKVTNLTIGPNIISFTAKDVGIRSVLAPAPDPSGHQSLNKFLNITNDSEDSWIALNVSYSSGDVAGLNESSLSMWRYNDTWSKVGGLNGVNIGQKYVYANITAFSIFAPMASITGAPNITSWENNKTNDESLTLTLNNSEAVKFNTTANQSIDTWNWFVDGADQSNNFDNLSTSFGSAGTHTVEVNATSVNGVSSTITWTISVPEASPGGDIIITSNTILNSGNYTYGNLTITNNATLVFNGSVILNATYLTIDAGSSISSDGKGYGAGSGPGAGNSNFGAGGAGGGYGGEGGDSQGANGGPTYGSSLAPVDLGSGGGNDTGN
ncbi:MAG TPA: right-handed parallel beta-helix repeat-containing protein, partial [Candidatus Limnocylindrales bacterium]|nr:right-handed parallel beta-helix repeat-containing protein [Candidatus Limnocylindrales bacterium]